MQQYFFLSNRAFSYLYREEEHSIIANHAYEYCWSVFIANTLYIERQHQIQTCDPAQNIMLSSSAVWPGFYQLKELMNFWNFW